MYVDYLEHATSYLVAICCDFVMNMSEMMYAQDAVMLASKITEVGRSAHSL